MSDDEKTRKEEVISLLDRLPLEARLRQLFHARRKFIDETRKMCLELEEFEELKGLLLNRLEATVDGLESRPEFFQTLGDLLQDDPTADQTLLLLIKKIDAEHLMNLAEILQTMIAMLCYIAPKKREE